MKRLFFLLPFLFYSGSIFSQGLFETASQSTTNTNEQVFQLNGFVRGSVFGAGDIYDFTNAFGEVSLQTHLKKDKFVMNADIRFRSGYNFNQPVSEFEIKEAYAGINTNSFDLFLGEQIVSWGRTDGFNPTNNITPNNYFFFSANPNDQKIPNFMMKADIRFSPQVDWEIIAIPIFRPSMYRYDLFDMGENVLFADAILPDKTLKNGTWATKLNIELSGIGFSASWFRGYDPFYGFDLKSVDFKTGIPVVTNVPSFYMKNALGIDVELPLGTWILRGEGAYNLTENSDNEMYIPNDDLNYVAAIEHDFGGFLTIIQYVGTYTFDFSELTVPVLSDPANMMAQLQYANEMINYESASFNKKIFHQQEKMNHAVSIVISKDFAYETINTELTGYYNFTSKECLIRPKLSCKIGSALTATAGYSFMKGPDKSIFSYAAPIMNGAFIELKASF
jgi:hypothetical protein